MKLVCSLPSNLKIATIASFVDGVLLEDNDAILERIEEANAYHLIAIYGLNEMVFPKEIEEYKRKILKTQNTGCLYYITDLGLAHLLKNLDLIHRTIYDPMTMITNHLDAMNFKAYGFHALGISNEITLLDTKKIMEEGNILSFLQVFGYRLMHTSRRGLLSLYGKKTRINIPKNSLTIKENIRSDHYPIYEDVYGTKIYRGYLLSLLETFCDLPLEYAFLEGKFLSQEIFIKALECFDERRKHPTSPTPIEKLKQLNLPIEDGFSYQDTVYRKEEF